MAKVHKQDPANSLLKRVMEDKHPQDATMYIRLKDAKDEGCKWRTSEEDHWVAHFACCLLDRSRKSRPGLQFHQFFEKPSHLSESNKQGGYDLSAGPYDNDTFRVRTMHKVLKGLWCDCNWEWRTSKSDNDHIQALLRQPDYASYLVVNVFYCLHDQRRMGETVSSEEHGIDKLPVPDLSSPLRTVIIDLTASQALLLPDTSVVINCKGLQDVPESVGEWQQQVSVTDFITATAGMQPLKVVKLDTILDNLDGYWKDQWKTSKLR